MGSGSIPTRTGGFWVPAGSVASEVASETDTEPYVYLYAPSFGWSWFISPWGGGPFFVGPWVHAPRHYSGSYRHYGGYPYYRGPRTVGPGPFTPRPIGPRQVAPSSVGPRYVAPRPAPTYVGPRYVAPHAVAPGNFGYEGRPYVPPAPAAPRYVAPPAYHAAPVMAPRPDFGGHMAAPPGGHFGGGPHR